MARMSGGQQRVQAPRRIGEYEVGGTLGEGTFAKVKYAVHATTGEPVAMKVLDKEKIIRHKMVDQIKREISVMKLVRHPNVVRLYEVLASRTKIYIILEFVTGGELFDKIVNKGRLEEEEARRYFQQLIDAMEYCHSKGVAHRDLKVEWIQTCWNCKISALCSFLFLGVLVFLQADGLLHTTCGTPNYVAPEVLSDRGYNGVLADIWSCGVILYVLLAGFLPFDEPDVPSLYKKIQRSDFGFPTWFSAGAKRLITGILQPNPKLRYRYQEIKKDPWFRTNYVPVPVPVDTADDNMNDVDAAFGAAPAAPAAAAGAAAAPSGAVKSAAPGGAASGAASRAAKSAAGSAGSAGSTLVGSENASGTCKGSGSSAGTSGCASCSEQQQQHQNEQQVQSGLEGPGDLKGSHRGGLSCQLRGMTPVLNYKSGRGVEHTPFGVFAILPSLLMVEMRHELGRTQESLQMRHALRAKLQDLITAPHTPNTANDKSSKGKGTGLKQTRPRQLAAYPRMGIIPRV
ncbi:unnamed protein product [Closterium sp. NIES-65]|nr:unnamed protein product [Closterium sp. NIES-65]